MGRGLTFLSSLAAAVLVWASAAGRAPGCGGSRRRQPAACRAPSSDEWRAGPSPDLPRWRSHWRRCSCCPPPRPPLAGRQSWPCLSFFTSRRAVALPIAATLWLLLGGRCASAASSRDLTGSPSPASPCSKSHRQPLSPEHGAGSPLHAEERFDLAAATCRPCSPRLAAVGLAILATALLVVRRGPSLPALYVAVATVSALVTLAPSAATSTT